MYNYMFSFWLSILTTFLPRYSSYPFYIVARVDGDGFNFSRNFLWNLTCDNLASIFSNITLIGLCIFLFYQFYKVIHAFIGGFYEDAI